MAHGDAPARLIESGASELIRTVYVGISLLLGAALFAWLMRLRRGLFEHAAQAGRVMLYYSTARISTVFRTLTLCALIVRVMVLYRVAFQAECLAAGVVLLYLAYVLTYFRCAAPIAAALAGTETPERKQIRAVQGCMIGSALGVFAIAMVLGYGQSQLMGRLARWLI